MIVFMITRTLLILLFASSLSACKPLALYMTNVEGPPEYVAGYEDGCDSGISAGGTIMQRITHPFKKDPEKLDNSLYKMGWNEGFSYCRFYVSAPAKF